MLFTDKRQIRAVWRIGGLYILAALLVFLIVFVAETFLHMVPCELCLWERGPWRVLLGIGVLALVLSPRYARWAAVAGLVCLLVSVGLGGLHVGVEQGWWPSPAAECHVALVEGHNFSDWMAHLPARPTKPCDLPDYPFGLPVSMTMLSAFYAVLVFYLAVRETLRLFRFVRNNRVGV
ncbi:dihydrolipoamide acyltransferase [Bombella intestini]|uniref:Dihydrolipoamide acyltransferase n=1 Tax=Bombella intestini TaxID=1539051 RepID=A0A1S8GP39_9PROT|nr:disulfide bond formation protein B [Bombella intestini]OOL17881.1 dihydrolipoamide acyltransferase [Bombella intestini]